MKIRVKKILTEKPKLIVLCETGYGEVSVYWKGNTPVENETYDVEFETDKLLEWGRDIVATEEQLAICDDNHEIKIVGDFESIDEDGYMVLRIDSSIMTFMTQDIPVIEGLRIQVRLDFIEVYPVEY